MLARIVASASLLALAGIPSATAQSAVQSEPVQTGDSQPGKSGEPTYYRDVLPILQRRCLECHRTGQIAPMAFASYEETRPWAKAIRQAVSKRQMPPWFADPCCGAFGNDRSLSDSEIRVLSEWAGGEAAEGDPADAPAAAVWNEGWNLDEIDAVIAMPEAFRVPPEETVEYQYFVAPVEFSEDRWVEAVEVRPTDRSVVHHAVVYVREPGDTWTRGPTMADILTVYAPGSGTDEFPAGMAKLIPAGADLVFEIHYTPNGKDVEDRTEVAVRFADARPDKRVITLQMDSTTFEIPAGASEHQVTVWGTLPNDALMIGFFPHMHLRGSRFEYTLVPEDGPPVTLLKVDPYNFFWQLSYRLAEPMPLKKGTRLNWIATYDNSRGNPLNPDPERDVGYGLQSWDEMMVGFFDIAVDADIDKETYFVR